LDKAIERIVLTRHTLAGYVQNAAIDQLRKAARTSPCCMMSIMPAVTHHTSLRWTMEWFLPAGIRRTLDRLQPALHRHSRSHLPDTNDRAEAKRRWL